MKLKYIALFCALVVGGNAWSIERQKMLNWCWAASVQDVIKQVGISQTQDHVAARLLGWPYDRPAYASEVVALFNMYGLKAWRVDYPASPAQLRSTLQAGWRVVALARPNGGTVGHFIVLQAADDGGNVVVSDPATGGDSTMPITALYRNWKWEASVVVGKPKSNAYYQRFSAPSSQLVDDTEDEPEAGSSGKAKPGSTPFSYKRPDWAN